MCLCEQALVDKLARHKSMDLCKSTVLLDSRVDKIIATASPSNFFSANLFPGSEVAQDP